MEKRFWFVLNNLPDFTLTSYQAINMSDLNKVSENNIVFLKQLHSLGVVFGMDFHLFYMFDPAFDDGERIKIMLMCRAYNEEVFADTTAENSAEKLISDIISSLAINSCYKLQLASEEEYVNYDTKYSSMSTITKKEYLTNPNYSNAPSKNGTQYYSISEWSAKKNARMYNTLKLMGQYKSPTVLRVDLIPAEDPNNIINTISGKGIYSKIQAEASFKAFGDNGVGVAKRDEAASRAIAFYDNYIKTMSTTLQFRASVNIFSDTGNNCRLLGDVLCSEILEKGLISQEFESGDFAIDHKLTAVNDIKDGIFEINKISEMKCLYATEEIAPFFSFPYLYPGESIGVRKETDPQVLSGGILLGKDTNGYEVRIPYPVFAKHAYISGVPGSGKTYSMKHLIHSLHSKGIPFLVFEPAKREYRGLYDVDAASKIPEYGEFEDNEKTDNIYLLSPKSNSLFPLHINPFEVPLGVCVNEYISVLFNVFSGAFTWPQPTPMILRKAILKAYRNRGFYGSEVITEERRRNVKFPNMHDLYTAFQDIMDNDSFYQGEIQGNIKGVLETRIGSLMQGDVGEIFNIGISTFSPENWNKHSIILELENLSNEHANFITLLVTSLIRLDLKRHPTLEEFEEDDPRRENKLRHVIFFEEAHNLIGKQTEITDNEAASSKVASTAFIKDMLAEVRALYQGIVIADQLPTAIAPEVLKNTSIKLAHRQTSADERAAIGSVMSADDIQLEMLAKFTRGQALMSYESDTLSKPFYMQVGTKFKYSSETMDDISLSKKLSGMKWYINILYSKSIEPRFRQLGSDFTCFERQYLSLMNKYFGQEGILVSDTEGGNEKNHESTLKGIRNLIQILLNRADDLFESAYGLNNVMRVMIDNDIGIRDENETLFSASINIIVLTQQYVAELNAKKRSLK